NHKIFWESYISALGFLEFTESAEKAASEANEILGRYWEGYNKLGLIFMEKGKYEIASKYFQKSVSINDNNADTLSDLGVCEAAINVNEKSIEWFKKSLAINPDNPKVLMNMGALYLKLEDEGSAIKYFAQSLRLDSESDKAWFNFGLSLKSISINNAPHELEGLIVQLLRRDSSVSPFEIRSAVTSFLKDRIGIKNLLKNNNTSWIEENIGSVLAVLDKSELLLVYLKIVPIADLEFEGLFARIRHVLLSLILKENAEFKYNNVLISLASQCFINEYVYREFEGDNFLIKEMEERVGAAFKNKVIPPIYYLICLSMFKPISEYSWHKLVLEIEGLELIKKLHIEEPQEEIRYKESIDRLTEITNKTSVNVNAQYEENPYPRWIKTVIPIAPLDIEAWLSKENLLFEKIPPVDGKLKVLIAGCGTGQHSIQTATVFSNCQVRAIDLSLASLGYAKRKSREFGINNIDYFQADILKLNNHSERYDLIESVGVLHHLKEPIEGWSILVKLLKRGGIMRLGFYSAIARESVNKVRRQIKIQQIESTVSQMKIFRQKLINENKKEYKDILISQDFYGLSGFRDLLFHAQESQFTLLEISQHLSDLGLRFCGFDSSTIHRRYVNRSDWYNLNAWHEYEKKNTRAFGGMYQFWCQKI
ncbi:MAG: methyltransferase domain-containing protein, partial [Gammaproteobacteria bacterium]|nr:methyltransferase domain-containing protein [Gammaproteobacteria bacterium]